MKSIWIRCLHKEDREALKEKYEEAKRKKKSERTEEKHFEYRVIGFQVRKRWINMRDNQMIKYKLNTKQYNEKKDIENKREVVMVTSKNVNQ